MPTATYTMITYGKMYRHVSANEAWATIRAGAGTNNNSSFLSLVRADDVDKTKFQQITRNIIMFDTSGLPNGCTVFSAVMYLYPSSSILTGFSGVSAANASLAIVNASPASATIVDTVDYANVGATRYATDITKATWDAAIGSPLAVTLNATAIAAISKTGYTDIGFRIVCDADNAEPTADNVTDTISYTGNNDAAYLSIVYYYNNAGLSIRYNGSTYGIQTSTSNIAGGIVPKFQSGGNTFYVYTVSATATDASPLKFRISGTTVAGAVIPT